MKKLINRFQPHFVKVPGSFFVFPNVTLWVSVGASYGASWVLAVTWLRWEANITFEHAAH